METTSTSVCCNSLSTNKPLEHQRLILWDNIFQCGLLHTIVYYLPVNCHNKYQAFALKGL